MRLGRVFGVEVGLNWSWFVVLVLIVWTLTAAVFPRQNPGLSDGVYVVMGIVAAVAFFVSLLAHELGHALQARRDGVEIDGVTLWLFGGVARFKGMFPSAGAEFRIAIAGPLVSLVLGGAFSLAAWLVSLPQGVDGVLAWLGYINLVLLVFNLLPALPLDGGRVLRSALWAARGSFASATRIAAGIGTGFGYLFVAAGLALFVLEGAFSGAWLAFVGWFLIEAARNESRYLLARQALQGLVVRDVMVREPATAPAGYTLGRFVDEIARTRRYTTYPVVDGDAIVGLLPLRCVNEVARADWDRVLVRDCMLPRDRVPVIGPGEPAFDAMAELGESDVRRGLVLEDGRLLGLLSTTDLVRVLELADADRRAA